MFFKSKKQAKDETDKNLQVNVDLEIVTKMNQEFAVSLPVQARERRSSCHWGKPTSPD